MRYVFNRTWVAAGILVVGSLPAMPQSGTRNIPPGTSSDRGARPAESGQRAPVAMEGYCPVSILAMHKWVKGNPALRATYDGKTYLFANAQGKRMFQADPAKYVPALGGDCVVALIQTGKRVPGNIRHAAFHKNRLFLFSNQDAQKLFLAAPAKYADADLALAGHCPVCRVNMGREVVGKPEVAAFHHGVRYLFPTAEQRRAFLADPDRYVAPAAPVTRVPAPAGSGTR